MILFGQRLIDLDRLQAAAGGMDRDRHVDSSAEAALLDGFSNLVLQLRQRPGQSDCHFEKAVIDRTDLHGDAGFL